MPEQTRHTFANTRSRLFGFGLDDRAELVRALNAHAGVIISSAARVLGNLADAEDIAQDIAETLLKSPPTGVRSWPGYLRTVAVNRALDQLRRRRDWSDMEPSGAVGDPESALYDLQRADILRRAIAKLPERDAQIFSLYYLGDLPQTDIANQMNMSANAVGVALHRLRARLAADVHALLGSTEGDTAK
jgi:RNA polymerase sigma-70 factor (ECF subfamily)